MTIAATSHAAWRERHGGLVFEIGGESVSTSHGAFLIGTMMDVASGRRRWRTSTYLLQLEHQRRRLDALPRRASFSTSCAIPRNSTPRGMKLFFATANADDVAWGAAHGMLDGVLHLAGTARGQTENDARAPVELCRLFTGIFASVHSIEAATAYRDGKELASSPTRSSCSSARRGHARRHAPLHARRHSRRQRTSIQHGCRRSSRFARAHLPS